MTRDRLLVVLLLTAVAALLLSILTGLAWLSHLDDNLEDGPNFQAQIDSFQLAFRIFSYIAIGSVVMLVIVHVTKRKPRPGFCVTCGYDLRASKDRCPECGTDVRKRSLD
jgi:hypothetical protein